MSRCRTRSEDAAEGGRASRVPRSARVRHVPNPPHYPVGVVGVGTRTQCASVKGCGTRLAHVLGTRWNVAPVGETFGMAVRRWGVMIPLALVAAEQVHHGVAPVMLPAAEHPPGSSEPFEPMREVLAGKPVIAMTNQVERGILSAELD